MDRLAARGGIRLRHAVKCMERQEQSGRETVTFFATPCGMLRLTDADGNAVPFSIRQEIRGTEIRVFDAFEQKEVRLDTGNQYTVLIPAAQLKKHADYILRIHGTVSFRYGDSDEYAVASLAETDTVTLSLGAQDLNDDEKCRQAVPVLKNGVQTGLRAPERYDESKFRGFAVYPLPEWSGCRFRLLDDSVPDIRFRLAWLLHTAAGAEPEAYAAVTNLTII